MDDETLEVDSIGVQIWPSVVYLKPAWLEYDLLSTLLQLLQSSPALQSYAEILGTSFRGLHESAHNFDLPTRYHMQLTWYVTPLEAFPSIFHSFAFLFGCCRVAIHACRTENVFGRISVL